MSIPVTCPECHAHFHVDDEFAGRPGRCPECAAVLQVPEAHPQPGPAEPEPHDPYGVRDFDHLPAPSRERREVRRDYEADLRRDYEESKPELRFDPHARAAKWEATGRGLRNLMVAVILITVAEVVEVSFTFIDGVKPGQGNLLTPRDKAMMVGNGLISIISMLLWAAGRIGCGRVPYVPARRVAFPAGVIAGLAAACGVLGFAGIIGGFLVMQNNLQAGSSLFMLGGCAFLPGLLGFVVAEIMGLVSQVKMATGLRDAAFGTASRVMLIVALLLMTLSMVGTCLVVIFAVSEAQKAQQQQLQQQQQQQPQAVGPAVAPPPAAKGKRFGAQNAPANNPPANNVPANGQQQPPPPFDPAEHPEVVYGIAIGRLLVYLTYATVSVACFQLGRRAIRREVGRLVGDPHDQHPDAHY